MSFLVNIEITFLSRKLAHTNLYLLDTKLI